MQAVTNWKEWGVEYPRKNGLYNVILRKGTEPWVAYWNNANRRFEEAVPDFSERGVDVDYWAELPSLP